LGKLRILSGEEVCKILRRHGFNRIRTKGSHIIMQRKEKDATITIPVPNHSEVRRGTLRSIIRQSRLPKELFESE